MHVESVSESFFCAAPCRLLSSVQSGCWAPPRPMRGNICVPNPGAVNFRARTPCTISKGRISEEVLPRVRLRADPAGGGTKGRGGGPPAYAQRSMPLQRGKGPSLCAFPARNLSWGRSLEVEESECKREKMAHLLQPWRFSAGGATSSVSIVVNC